MSKKKNPTSKNQMWIEAQRRYRLSDAHIQMAKELGLNPKKFGGLANTKQEPWKAPLPDFIEAIYISNALGKRAQMNGNPLSRSSQKNHTRKKRP